MRVTLNQTEINRLTRSRSGPVAKDLMRRSNRVKNKAKRIVRVDTGVLRASISDELRADRGALTARIGSNVEYAFYVERRYPYLEPSLDAAR